MDSTEIYIKNLSSWKDIYDIYKKGDKEIAVVCLVKIRYNQIYLCDPLYYNVGINDYQVSVDKNVLLKLIKYCNTNSEYFPCVIHNHRKYGILNFSKYDRKMEECFNDVADAMKCGHRLVMILFGVSLDEIIVHVKDDSSISGNAYLKL